MTESQKTTLRAGRALMLVALYGTLTANVPAAEPTAATTSPAVMGNWEGTWGPYNPAKSAALEKEKCKSIECAVSVKEGVWHATFEGECGRPYKYRITMEGRRVGDAVLFKGTTDLGEKDGGVFDWVGRAHGDEFVGFYTGGNYSGVFQMKKKDVTAKETPDAE